MACNYLKEHGYSITDRNFRCKIGEIDLIGYHDGYLCFIEVKYRNSSSMGFPEEAVNLKKQMTICRVSDYYRVKKRVPEHQNIRFDVVSILGENIKFIQNAFPYI